MAEERSEDFPLSYPDWTPHEESTSLVLLCWSEILLLVLQDCLSCAWEALDL